MAEVTKFMDKNLIPPTAKIDSVIESAPSVSINKDNYTEVPKSSVPEVKTSGRAVQFVKVKLNGSGESRVG